MKKLTLGALMMALAFTVNAQQGVQYFFSPEGNGEGTGENWENAAPGEYLGATLSGAEAGTEFYLMEGSYLPDLTTNFWYIPQGVIIKGGYPATQTGIDTSIDYAQGGQSVFSADLDGDGKGDNTGYAFVYIGQADKPSDKDETFYKDWALTSISGITFRDGARDLGKYWGNMVFMKHVKADFHYCQFLNNENTTEANGAIVAWGSQLRCFDCIFRDNVSTGSGAAFLVRARNSDSSNTDPNNNSLALFERCEFTGNYCPGTYGGGAAIADNAGTVYFINNTFSGAYCQRAGGAFRNSTNDVSYFISNTFFNNYSTNETNAAGDAISSGTGSTCYWANNIMVNPADKDKFDAANHAVIFLQNADTKSYSAGYNVFGTIFDNGNNKDNFPSTDKLTKGVDNIYTKELVFGSNDLADNGGAGKTIAPQMDVTSFTLTDLQAAVEAWPIDDAVKEVMRLDLDQRGYKRAATTMSGSYDLNGTEPEIDDALDNIAGEKVMDNRIFSLQGHYMGTDIQALPAGMYIQNGKKVVRLAQ